MQTVGKWIGGMASALVLVALGYGTAGMIGGTIPRNARWVPPENGVRILIESNGSIPISCCPRWRAMSI